MSSEPIEHRSTCALSSALDIIGDKWSLLIVRDLCLGKSKYGDFLASPEGIPTNILASRLKYLETNGILDKRPYQQKPLRYAYFLTAKGADFMPVIQQLVVWAAKYIPDCTQPPSGFMTIKPEDIIKSIS